MCGGQLSPALSSESMAMPSARDTGINTFDRRFSLLHPDFLFLKKFKRFMSGRRKNMRGVCHGSKSCCISSLFLWQRACHWKLFSFTWRPQSLRSLRTASWRQHLGSIMGVLSLFFPSLFSPSLTRTHSHRKHVRTVVQTGCMNKNFWNSGGSARCISRTKLSICDCVCSTSISILSMCRADGTAVHLFDFFFPFVVKAVRNKKLFVLTATRCATCYFQDRVNVVSLTRFIVT